jgi:hypothetical protein
MYSHNYKYFPFQPNKKPPAAHLQQIMLSEGFVFLFSYLRPTLRVQATANAPGPI